MSLIKYTLLTGVDAKELDPKHLDWPPDSLVLFAHRDDKYLGRIGLIQLPHLEGIEIIEEERNGLLMKTLVDKMEAVLKSYKRTAAFAFVSDENLEMLDYVPRLGYKLVPLTVWVKDLTKE